jgi:hypothetical protein
MLTFIMLTYIGINARNQPEGLGTLTVQFPPTKGSDNGKGDKGGKVPGTVNFGRLVVMTAAFIASCFGDSPC